VPTTRLLSVQTNAGAIWSALASGATDPVPVPVTDPATILIWRQEHVACFRSLDPEEADTIALLIQGIAFADICARLVFAHGEETGVATAGQWLARWVADGLLRHGAASRHAAFPLGAPSVREQGFQARRGKIEQCAWLQRQ